MHGKPMETGRKEGRKKNRRIKKQQERSSCGNIIESGA